MVSQSGDFPDHRGDPGRIRYALPEIAAGVLTSPPAILAFILCPAFPLFHSSDALDRWLSRQLQSRSEGHESGQLPARSSRNAAELLLPAVCFDVQTLSKTAANPAAA